ncbi:MAG TPA: hypothetical protein PLR74_17645, partial [Agriterribacter sp.]|nr:hypothetical protein [Agriterribacter sp.]
MKKFYIIALFCIVGAILLFTFSHFYSNKTGKAGNAETISYNFQVRPILSDKCYACHGPDANKREA